MRHLVIGGSVVHPVVRLPPLLGEIRQRNIRKSKNWKIQVLSGGLGVYFRWGKGSNKQDANV